MAEDFKPAEQFIIHDLDTLKLYFDPLRSRLVTLMVGQPRSVSELAERLQVPFTRLYYHIRLLEKHGLIMLVEKKVILGGVHEKFYRAAARNYIVDRSLIQAADSIVANPLLEALLSNVIDSATDELRLSVQQGLTDLSRTPPDSQALLLRRGLLNLTDSQVKTLQQHLITLLAEFQNEPLPDSDDGQDDRFYAVVVMTYPVGRYDAKH